VPFVFMDFAGRKRFSIRVRFALSPVHGGQPSRRLTFSVRIRPGRDNGTWNAWARPRTEAGSGEEILFFFEPHGVRSGLEGEDDPRETVGKGASSTPRKFADMMTEAAQNTRAPTVRKRRSLRRPRRRRSDDCEGGFFCRGNAARGCPEPARSPRSTPSPKGPWLRGAPLPTSTAAEERGLG